MTSKLNKDKTFIKNMHIDQFRAMENLTINIGEKLTLIGGINGVGKSSILGMLAQICSFRVHKEPEEIDSNNINKENSIDPLYRTIYNNSFESEFSDHFKISSKFDTPDKKYNVEFDINDALEKLVYKAQLRSTSRDGSLRFVLRRTESINDNTSRNITFPVIYLDLKRLTPFANRKLQYVEVLSDEEKEHFKQISNKIFTPIYTTNNRGTLITSNKDNVSSTVLSNGNYDIVGASTGEDNLGQIISALLSFARLKKEYNNYKGGLLLIDELDAGLFPKAQIGLLDVLRNFSSKYNIQVVFTTHSATIISKMLYFKEQSNLNKANKNDIGINFLNNPTGKIENYGHFSFKEMVASLNVEPLKKDSNFKINCYCEDDEAYVFLDSIITREQKKKLNLMKNITLGGEQLLTLSKAKVPEFSSLSLIILDGDKANKIKNNKNFLCLPSKTPPDQLMFHLLDIEPPDSSYWSIDPSNWNKQIFENLESTKNIRNNLSYNQRKQSYSFSQNNNAVIRDFFKEWFKENEHSLKNSKTSPIRKIWNKNNKETVAKFRTELDKKIDYLYSKNNFLS
ncbi:AAA family ATPase [Ligilactobacillus salivarius]|uniref:AAA family ATPase n=1 Tax=Ligilactobacillus salivarius TaxID=1624 RepID=UPI0031FE622D